MAFEFLWDLEEKYWARDVGFQKSHLLGQAWMVLPSPLQKLGSERALDSLSRAERWQTVGMAERHVVELSNDAAILVYSATAASSEEAREYRALCSSAYVRYGDKWLMAEHQQTPMM